MRTFFLALTILLTSCSLRATPAPMPLATVTAPTAVVITPTPLPTPTLAPFEQYTIPYLGRRTYGGGKIEVVRKLAETDTFANYSIRYPSDGLNIYGFMNVPKEIGRASCRERV